MLWATLKGHIKVTQLLIDTVSDRKAKNRWGSTALMQAVVSQNPDMVQLLIDSGADTQTTNNKGDNALKQTEKAEQKEIIEKLKLLNKEKDQ